jgi:hypothetical protein
MILNVHSCDYTKNDCDSFCRFLFGENYNKTLSFDYSIMSFFYDNLLFKQNKIFLDLSEFEFDSYSNMTFYPDVLVKNISSNVKSDIYKLLSSPYYVDMVSSLVKYNPDQGFELIEKLFSIINGILEKKNLSFVRTFKNFGNTLFKQHDNKFIQFKLLIEKLDLLFVDTIDLNIPNLGSKQLYEYVIDVLYKFRCIMVHKNSMNIMFSDAYPLGSDNSRNHRKFKEQYLYMFMNEKFKLNLSNKSYDFLLYSIDTSGLGNFTEERTWNTSVIISRWIDYFVIVKYLCILITLVLLLPDD